MTTRPDTSRWTRRAALAAAALVPFSGRARAPVFPDRPVRVVVPYPAGGVVDLVARVATDAMAPSFPQPIVVEARTGANGSLAAEAVARAAPDGHTWLVTAPFIVANRHLQPGLTWDGLRDFAHLARIAESPSVLVVSAPSPANSLAEFVAMARAAAKPLSFRHGGVGTTPQLAAEILMHQAGFRLVPVPYRGSPPIVPDLLSGLVDASILPVQVAMPHVAAGALRVLVNVSERRWPALPETPTIVEAGYPEAAVTSWYGFAVPAATPAPVQEAIALSTNAALEQPLVRERLAKLGAIPAPMPRADFARFVEGEDRRWGEAVRRFSIRAE